MLRVLLDAERFPSFDGASGKVGFGADGRRESSLALLDVFSVVQEVPGGYSLQSVGNWTLGAGFVLKEEVTITWADGSVFPLLPGAATVGPGDEGLSTPREGLSKLAALLIGGCAGLALGIGIFAGVLALVVVLRRFRGQSQTSAQRKTHMSSRRTSIFQGARRRSSVVPMVRSPLSPPRDGPLRFLLP
jgi:hypothetical protein